MSEPPAKRRRLPSSDGDPGPGPASLSRSISPPKKQATGRERTLLPSPFRLTTIRDLSPETNVGAVSLGDLVGDPLISACWEFNYLHDVDFLMSHFDEDTRSLVKVHIVHGFWKREDPNRLALGEQASRYENVNLHVAYMPEIFGTHHTKMLILFRHDDTAQVIIHTANMISKDWTNMTNAVWQSPPLPLLGASTPDSQLDAPIGSGHKFKFDLLSYLKAYNTIRNVCKSLVEELTKYDFSAVRGALIGSVPGRHAVLDDPSLTRWGWAAMKQALRSVPIQQGKSEVVAQISSIATLGGTDAWLQRTLFDSLSSSAKSDFKPSFKVVFPTADEIRLSLDGYVSGGSIHTKIQSSQQAKQLQYLRPIFCHWSNDAPDGIASDGTSSNIGNQDAGRGRAAPHIKTYIRYGEKSIDWALLTSSNISKQAWGEAPNASREMRIASWEIGVLVWPELLGDNAKMVGTFKTDMPSARNTLAQSDDACPLVGLRIPYNLPLKRYGPNEKPWVATADYSEPDCKGRVWTSWAA